MYSQELVQVVDHLLDRAEKGLLQREEFYQLWPGDEKSSDPFLEQLFEDLESAIEHLPGSLLSGKVNLSRWRSSSDYRHIVADRQVLSKLGVESSVVLLEKRRRLLSAGLLPREPRNEGFEISKWRV